MPQIQVLLRPGNALRTPAEELEPLAEELRALYPHSDVRIVTGEQRGRGVTWWEVLDITLRSADTALDTAKEVKDIAEIGGLLWIAVKWARDRMRREADQDRVEWEQEQQQKPPRRRARKPFTPRPPPRYIGIHGPDGRVIRSVLVTDPEGEVEDRTEEDRRLEDERGLGRPPP
jgi:hypothetical protein